MDKTTTYARIHKKIYWRMLDELDKEDIEEIMCFPDSEKSLALNARVEAEIKRQLQEVRTFIDNN